MREESVRLGHANEWLHGSLHEPDEAARGAALICAPLFEERKSAQRALVEFARALCRAHWLVLRFDYRGCGDSAGDFDAYSVPDWQEDVREAAAFLRARGPDLPLALIGLRLGGALALRSAGACAAETVALWAPALDGRRYLRDVLRRKMVKEMMGQGQARTRRNDCFEDLEAGRRLDFDGYAVTSRLYRDLAALVPPANGEPSPRRALLAHVGPNERLPTDLTAWAAALAASGCRADTVAFRLPPFWSLIGYADTAPLAERTIRWMEEER